MNNKIQINVRQNTPKQIMFSMTIASRLETYLTPSSIICHQFFNDRPIVVLSHLFFFLFLPQMFASERIIQLLQYFYNKDLWIQISLLRYKKQSFQYHFELYLLMIYILIIKMSVSISCFSISLNAKEVNVKSKITFWFNLPYKVVSNFGLPDLFS